MCVGEERHEAQLARCPTSGGRWERLAVADASLTSSPVVLAYASSAGARVGVGRSGRKQGRELALLQRWSFALHL